MAVRVAAGGGCRREGDDEGDVENTMVVMWFGCGSGVGRPEVSPDKWWRRKNVYRGEEAEISERIDDHHRKRLKDAVNAGGDVAVTVAWWCGGHGGREDEMMVAVVVFGGDGWEVDEGGEMMMMMSVVASEDGVQW
ncbi:hypothetical protein Tco_1084711 [Tanacetum coccineum]